MNRAASTSFTQKIVYAFCKNFIFVMLKLFWRFKVEGMENVPREGSIIIAANHRSYADPPVVGCALSRQVHFMAKEELFRFRPFGLLIKTLNAHPLRRSGDVAAFKMAMTLLKEGNGVILFPEGRRIKTQALAPAKPGVGLLSKSSECKIIPAYIHNTAYMKWFKKIIVCYGIPLSPEGFDSHQALADEVMRRIQLMKDRIKEN